MLRTIKHIFGVALLLLAGVQTMRGFALAGPGPTGGTGGDSWETPVIGYALGGDIVTPKNIGEEYRRNTPVIYYVYDESFAAISGGYFGSNGEAAVDSAIATFNAVTNVDSYSANLMEEPFTTEHMNYQAQGLGVTDLKSEVMGLLAEQMGLTQPERYSWTLHDRYLPTGGKCPFDELYLVVQRNFDPVISGLTQIQYSDYVNNTLYTYMIDEFCTGPNPLAITEPFSTDPFVLNYTSVASLGVGLGVDNFQIITNFGGNAELINAVWTATQVGGYYTGLTRDDVGGLRYLLSTNNIQYEDPAPGALMWSVSTNATQQLFPNTLGTTNTFATTNGGFYYYDGQEGYGDLTAFLEAATTNSPATLELLYPGVIVSSYSNTFIYGSNATVVSYLTNVPGGVYGEPILVTATNYTTVPLEIYYDTFANVFTNHYYKSSTTYLQTTTVGPIKGGSYYANTTTNISTQTITSTNFPAGDFYVLSMFNTNACALDIIKPFYTNTVAFTNIIPAVTNTTTVTVTSNTVSATVVLSQAVVTYFTNYIYIINPVTCATVTNATSWYQGVGRVQFVRVPDQYFDSLSDTILPQYWFTNYYDMVAYTNNSFVTRHFERVVVTPDIIFSAADQASPNVAQIGAEFGSRNLNFDTANVLPGLAGPGTIVSPSIITLDKVGDVFGNGSLAVNNLSTNDFLSQATQFGLLAWASFDGTTNAPVVYPNGTSIANIENQLIISFSPTPAAGLPNAVTNTAYSVNFTATGATWPYSWSLAPGSLLPSGLSFTQVSAAGVLSGTPAAGSAGTYDFEIQLTDAANRVVVYSYTLTINN